VNPVCTGKEKGAIANLENATEPPKVVGSKAHLLFGVFI